MKKRKIKWLKLLLLCGIFSLLVYGITWVFQHPLLSVSLATDKQEPVKIKDLPKNIQEIFTQLQDKYPKDERIMNMMNHYDVYPEQLLEMAVRNEDTLSFVYRYPVRKDQVSKEPLSKAEISTIPSLYQWDERWGYAAYGEGIMGYTACGPTSLSIVLSYLTQDTTLTPLKIAQFSDKNGYYIDGQGTQWQLFYDYSERVGVSCTSLTINHAAFLSALQQNHPIIASMVPGDFTTSGHLIVLAGLDEMGNVIVRDPNSSTRTAKHWDINLILSQTSAAWEFHL